MEKEKVLSYVDHTLLKVNATWNEVKKVLDDAIVNNCASACISPCYVKQAVYYVNGNLPICTVIGFPSGQTTTNVKLFETEQAIKYGASEIDMVINIGWLKDKNYEELLNEITLIANICHSNPNKYIPLKVIVESCLLTEYEIRKMCELVAKSGADFIKTSTGFSTNGATPNDVVIMKEEMDKWNKNKELKDKFPTRENIKIKASGGIKNFEDAEMFLFLGADRLGTSRLI